MKKLFALLFVSLFTLTSLSAMQQQLPGMLAGAGMQNPHAQSALEKLGNGISNPEFGIKFYEVWTEQLALLTDFYKRELFSKCNFTAQERGLILNALDKVEALFVKLPVILEKGREAQAKQEQGIYVACPEVEQFQAELMGLMADPFLAAVMQLFLGEYNKAQLMQPNLFEDFMNFGTVIITQSFASIKDAVANCSIEE